MRYVIHFTDGAKMDSFTLEGAMRLIASRHRVRRGDLITDTTEEKISVWLYGDEISIAEIFCSSVTAKTMR
jgi:phosphoglycerate-specific signal transduction histidine kinase